MDRYKTMKNFDGLWHKCRSTPASYRSLLLPYTIIIEDLRESAKISPYPLQKWRWTIKLDGNGKVDFAVGYCNTLRNAKSKAVSSLQTEIESMRKAIESLEGE